MGASDDPEELSGGLGTEREVTCAGHPARERPGEAESPGQGSRVQGSEAPLQLVGSVSWVSPRA